jgi:hypothetical protein
MSRRFTARKVIAGIAVAAAAVVAVLAVSSQTGANFSDSDTGSASVSTATLALNLSDAAGHTGTFDLNYANLKPGDSVVKVFKVTNNGSIPGTAKLGQPVTPTTVPSGLTVADAAELKVGVDGVASPVSVTSLPSSFNLGTVAPGETKAYSLRIELASSAGNEWQGKTLAGTATVTLEQ